MGKFEEIIGLGASAQAQIEMALKESHASVDTIKAAKILGCSVRILERLRAEGHGPPYRQRAKGCKVTYPLGGLYSYKESIQHEGKQESAEHRSGSRQTTASGASDECT